MQLKTSRFDKFDAYIYLDGRTVKKLILLSAKHYFEYGCNDLLSEDCTMLLPKTARGKAVRLSAAAMTKRKNHGMAFTYYEDNGYASISVYNTDTQRDYYTSYYEKIPVKSFADFTAWVNRWCDETTAADIAALETFKKQTRQHVRFKEGDVFRFPITRREYGYGRIILDYDRMRKSNEPFWDVYVHHVILCAPYLIITEDKHVSAERLRHLKSLPSQQMFDAAVYYGAYEIIGNIPIGTNEDYPLQYGASISALDAGKKKVMFQNGKDFLVKENTEVLPAYQMPGSQKFINNGVGYKYYFPLDTFRKCIEENSIAPYWENEYTGGDLRNPSNTEALKEIRRQFGLE